MDVIIQGVFKSPHLFKIQYLRPLLTDFHSKMCFGKLEVMGIGGYREIIELNITIDFCEYPRHAIF